jgi:hypothetical protein
MYTLPNPSGYNAEQSDELITEAINIIKNYFNDKNMIIHRKNASEDVERMVEEMIEITQELER